MGLAARDALAAFLRREVRAELAAELEQIDELRLRVNVLEAMNGVPTGLPGARGPGNVRSCGCARWASRCAESGSRWGSRAARSRPI